ncbi:MAG: Ser-Thr-rich GPI-anchored membrane family protein, partial [Bacteroidota bacterium]
MQRLGLILSLFVIIFSCTSGDENSGGTGNLPQITLLEPDGNNDTVDASFTLLWTDSDNDSDAEISLYYDSDDTGYDGILIVSGISEDDEDDAYEWDTASLPDGTYYIYALITDGTDTGYDYSSGFVTVEHSVNESPTITITQPDGVDDTADNSYTIEFEASDPDSDAMISLYYDLNSSGLDGTIIVSDLSESTSSYIWNTLSIPEGDYYIYGIIEDEEHEVSAYSTGLVTIVHDSPSVISIAGGYKYSLALLSDGRVLAWGCNYDGQLGDGTTTDRHTPVEVTGITDAVMVEAGYYHSLALLSDGRVLAWGSNEYGQLGDGTTTDRHTPVEVTGITDAVAIAAGGYYSLALLSDASVLAWGCNEYGLLGDGTTTYRHTPVEVTGITDAVMVEAGYYHSLA